MNRDRDFLFGDTMVTAELRTGSTATVPCAGCRACCESNELIVLVDGDDPAQYRTFTTGRTAHDL